MTVHHLLTHTSGLGNYFNDVFLRTARPLFRKVDDYKPLVVGETLAFEPGSRWQYSNTGMLLLGVVIEKATGEDYFQHVREHVYAPAGMKNTDCYDMDQPVENLAIGYDPDPDCAQGWRNNLYDHVVKGGPAGGGFSTVGDLHRYARAMLAGELVSVASLEAMWSDQSGTGYGYGYSVEQGPAGKVVGHGGGFPGLNGELRLFLDKDCVVAVLANHDRAASPLADRIGLLVERLEGE